MNNRQVDVLVIGSGIGGMCAAAYLSHKGYQVLVTEGAITDGADNSFAYFFKADHGITSAADASKHLPVAPKHREAAATSAASFWRSGNGGI